MFASMHGADPLPGALARLRHPGGLQRPARWSRPSPVPYVDVDHVGGVAAAVTHLLDTGRRRIATIAGPQDMVAGIDRLTGYREALRGGRARSSTSRSATSPASPASARCASCSPTTPSWTRSSWRPT